MKFCTHCGAEVMDEAVFCVKCGCQTTFGKQQQNAQAAAAAAAAAANNRPMAMLKTNRGLVKYILLGMITFGIYPLVVMSAVSTDINLIAGRYDGKRTTHYCLMAFIFSWLTFGIAPFVWNHKISARIQGELMRRNICYNFGAGTFWGWGVLGSLLFGIGPLVYTHKLLTSMNMLAAHYNQNG